jgi:hypothetical protein
LDSFRSVEDGLREHHRKLGFLWGTCVGRNVAAFQRRLPMYLLSRIHTFSAFGRIRNIFSTFVCSPVIRRGLMRPNSWRQACRAEVMNGKSLDSLILASRKRVRQKLLFILWSVQGFRKVQLDPIFWLTFLRSWARTDRIICTSKKPCSSARGWLASKWFEARKYGGKTDALCVKKPPIFTPFFRRKYFLES